MAENLATIAMEKSTLVVSLSFTDEAGVSVVPTALTWTLTDAAGAVINTREDVVVSTPATTVKIVLSGNDLAIQAGETAHRVERRLTVEATYTSDLGSDLPMTWAGAFMIENLVAVS
jgi:hypothetical protein